MRECLLHPEKDTAEIDVHHRFPLVDGLVLQGTLVSADPGVVDEDVEVAKACNCLINNGLDLLFRANIDVKPESSPTPSMDFRDQAFASLLPAMIADHNVRAF